jgi:hypothetical protein
MRKQSCLAAGSLIIAFVASIPLACAQIASDSAQIPIGDVWPPDAKQVHSPTPIAAGAEAGPSWNISLPTDTEALHGDCTVRAQNEPRNHVSGTRGAIMSGKHRQHLSFARAPGEGHSPRNRSPQDVGLVFRCRIDAPSSEIGTAP